MEDHDQKSSPKKFLGTIVNHEGKMEVWKQGEEEILMAPPEEEWKEFPEAWKNKHQRVFNTILIVISQLQRSERTYPITRKEILGLGVKKRILGELEEFGLIGIESSPLIRDKKNIGNRSVVYFTPKGFALVRIQAQELSEKLEKEDIEKAKALESDQKIIENTI